MSTVQEIAAGFAQIIRKVTGTPAEQVMPEMTLTDDLKVDSLAMIEIIIATEEHFDVEIPDSDVEELHTVGDALECILRAKA